MNELSIKEFRERKHWDAFAQKYDSLYKYREPFTKYKIAKKVRDFTSALKEYQFTGKKIKMLEIGCGTGEYTKKIAKVLPLAQIVGLDISSKIIREAELKCRGCHNVSFIAESVYHNRFRDSSFDVVYGYYVLHHLIAKKALDEIYKLLKPGGIAYFCEPNILNPVVYIIKSSPWIKERIGDTQDEWAINPLGFKKYRNKFKILKISFSEYVLQTYSLPISFIIRLDKLTSFLRKIPVIKYLGGSTQILLQKHG